MTIRPKIRNAALGAALAAIAATAWAANSSWSSAESFYPGAQPLAATPAPAPVAPAPAQPIAVQDSLGPNETIVTDEQVRVDHARARAPVVVEERRLSEDERIQSVVMDVLARESRLSGKIGVESHDAVVRLTGYTSTVGQAERAGRIARGVTGVRYVENLIRPRVGGMVSS